MLTDSLSNAKGTRAFDPGEDSGVLKLPAALYTRVFLALAIVNSMCCSLAVNFSTSLLIPSKNCKTNETIEIQCHYLLIMI